MQADLGLGYPHMPEDTFSHGAPYYDVAIIQLTMSCHKNMTTHYITWLLAQNVMTMFNFYCSLTLSTLGKIFSRRHFEIFFLIFLRRQDLTFHANCLLTGKNKKNNIILSSAENAQRVVKFKSYDNQNLTFVVISYEIYENRLGLFS